MHSADLSEAMLNSVLLREADLSMASLYKTTMVKVNADLCKFEGADMRKMTIEFSSFTKVSFDSSDLSGAMCDEDTTFTGESAPISRRDLAETCHLCLAGASFMEAFGIDPAATSEVAHTPSGGGGGGGVGPGAYERRKVQEPCLNRMYNLKSSRVYDTTNPEKVRNEANPQLNRNQRRDVRPDSRVSFPQQRGQSWSAWGIGRV